MFSVKKNRRKIKPFRLEFHFNFFLNARDLIYWPKIFRMKRLWTERLNGANKILMGEKRDLKLLFVGFLVNPIDHWRLSFFVLLSSKFAYIRTGIDTRFERKKLLAFGSFDTESFQSFFFVYTPLHVCSVSSNGTPTLFFNFSRFKILKILKIKEKQEKLLTDWDSKKNGRVRGECVPVQLKPFLSSSNQFYIFSRNSSQSNELIFNEKKNNSNSNEDFLLFVFWCNLRIWVSLGEIFSN